jgi:hypothetical protein
VHTLERETLSYCLDDANFQKLDGRALANVDDPPSAA